MSKLILERLSFNKNLNVSGELLSDVIDKVKGFLLELGNEPLIRKTNNALIEIVSNLNYYSYHQNQNENHCLVSYLGDNKLMVECMNVSNKDNKDRLMSINNELMNLSKDQLFKLYDEVLHNGTQPSNTKNGLGLIRCFLSAKDVQISFETMQLNLFKIYQTFIFEA